jgi:rare lipoprotein A
MWFKITACIFLLILALSAGAQNDSIMTGVASFYAHKFEGRKTASGELFRQDSLTAAHKYLPFGTLVEVVNLSNDSVVVVKINDRLPQSSKRTIDLSYAAATQLKFIKKGLTKVEIRLLPDSVIPKEAPEKTDSILINND